MSYRAYQVARLHARDLVFLVRYAAQRVRSGRKPTRLVMCNSFQKSGTHMLYQLLCSLPGWEPWNDIVAVQALNGIMNTANHIRWKLGSAPDRSIVRCHLMYTDEIRDVLAAHETKRFFIYRDLRDVAVSHARWVTREQRIFLHDIYTTKLADDDARLMATIEGTPLGSPFGSNVSHPSIGQDFARWIGWINDPGTVPIRFEDLVGARGGGSEERRMATVRRILEHLDVDMGSDDAAANFGSDRLDPGESHTFKKGGRGQIGDWRHHFRPEHKDAFKRVAGQTLIDLGYEQDLDW